MKYVIGIDQSTQGTKALLLDYKGKLIARTDLPHSQIIDEKGWVEHDPEEIYKNTVQVVKNVIDKAGIDKSDVAAIGISNQRETSFCWNSDGTPIYNAVVWQCSRGTAICERIAREDPSFAQLVQEHTGLRFSPYFSAAKIAWVLENVPEAKEKAKNKELLCGTADSYLIYRLTEGRSFKTDYSNASRTQLFDINTLEWDERICQKFGIPVSSLPEVCFSDSDFGKTSLEGYFDTPVPICGVMGDSHAALFGQGCIKPGMIKATYGTGSSIMMNIGTKPVFSDKGIVTSLAWGMDGKVEYVLEGNINYSGAVITWLQKDMKLIENPGEATECAILANPADKAYLVPAFSGLNAPYWDSEASASLSGMTRVTGKNEICRAALDSIAYQINDIISIMREDSGIEIGQLKVDGGPTKSEYLMSFQSALSQVEIVIPDAEELSGIGAAFAAGISAGIYDRNEIFKVMQGRSYKSEMDPCERKIKLAGWKAAVEKVLS